MGALVLTFGGVLGLLMLQNSERNVSQVTESRPEPPAAAAPYLRDESAGAAATNSAANAAVPQTNSAAPFAPVSAANNAAASGEMDDNKSGVLAGRLEQEKKAYAPDPNLAGADADRAKEVSKSAAIASGAQPPPPPAATDVVGGARDARKDDPALKTEAREEPMAKRKQNEDELARRSAPAPAKSGPMRSGPLNTQSNQIQNQVYDMPVERKVGGKTFNNRNGAWYDSSYKGQVTNNYRRGTDEYKKLDGGLRSIADNLGGTVVVVWKDKAYRIQ